MDSFLKPKKAAVCARYAPDPVVKTETQLRAEAQRNKVNAQIARCPDYPTTYDVQDDTLAMCRPKRTDVNAGSMYLTALSEQRDQWHTSPVKNARDATRFTWSDPGRQHAVPKGPNFTEAGLYDTGIKRHDASMSEFFGSRDPLLERKRQAPSVRTQLMEDPAINPREALRPTKKSGSEVVYGVDVGGGAARGRDYESFSRSRDRQYTVSTMATRAGSEYGSDGLNAGGGRNGGGAPAMMTEHFVGARVPGSFASRVASARSKTTAPTDFADHQLATRHSLVPSFEVTSTGTRRIDAGQGRSMQTDFAGGARVRNVGNFLLRGSGGVGRASGGAVSGVENKGWTGSRMRNAEIDASTPRITTGNGQLYGGSTSYGSAGGFNKDRSREQDPTSSRLAVGAPEGLFAGAELNLQQGGRHPITGSLESKPPVGGKKHGVATGPDDFGLPVSCPRAITLFTPVRSAPTYGGGSMTGERGSFANDARPLDSEWDAAKSDMDGSKRSKIIQARVQDSMAQMKAMAEMGLVIR